jgi:hypothetical protein
MKHRLAWQPTIGAVMFMVISPVRAALRYMLAPDVSVQVIAPVVVALVCTV